MDIEISILQEILTDMRKRGCWVKYSESPYDTGFGHIIFPNNKALCIIDGQFMYDSKEIKINPNNDPVDVFVTLYNLCCGDTIKEEKIMFLCSLLCFLIICSMNGFIFGWYWPMVFGIIPLIVATVFCCPNLLFIKFYKAYKALENLCPTC